MLSIYPISTPQGMSTYYDADGYYAKGDEQAQLASQWFGKGAKTAGLSGYVKPEDFQPILDGNTPDGRRLGRTVGGEWKHRAGVDLTFSAPKSLSIMALVAGDDRLITAHDAAVKVTLNHIEEKILETRVWDSTAKTQFKQRNLEMIAGLFRHEVNRNQDPHLHTHAVIANMTLPSDGKWRSIEGASLLRHKMEMGAMYRAELAMNVREMGYEVERSHRDGRFDLKGVPKSVMAAFSTRATEIREALAGYNYQNAKTAANATLMTRNHKVTVDRDILHKDWTEKGERLGLKARIPSVRVPDQSVLADKAEETRLATEAVDYSIRHLSERASVFNLSDLRTTANGYGVGQFRPKTLDAVIASDKRLIASRHRDHVGREYITTQEAISTEKETIASMIAAQDTVRPFMAFADINKGLDGTFLNEGQQNAVRALLSGRDRIMGIQGYAGVGKTTLLTVARELAEKKNYDVMGLAPSASAAKTLQDEAGITSKTLQKFLGQYDGYAHGRGSREGRAAVQAEFKNKMIVVDESSLASTGQIRDLFRIVEVIRPARLVLVGDSKQLNAVDAGKPFAQLQAHGMKTLKVDQIVRQKTPELRTAVHAAIAGNISAAFRNIGDNIIEAEKPPPGGREPSGRKPCGFEPGTMDRALAEAAFKAWNAMPADKREGTGIAAPTHVIRQSINALVREQLEREGRIVGPEQQIMALKSAGYTSAEKGRAKNYFAGDQVIFNRARNGVEQGDVLSVAGRNEDTNTIALQRDNGDVVLFNVDSKRAAQSVDILRPSPIGIRQGDRIRFTRNDDSLGLVNSGLAEITKIDSHGAVTLIKEDGGTLTLEGDAPALKFIDHAWASTVHAFQGRTVDTIIGVMHSSHPHLSNQKAFYVAISRARESATLITDDRQRLGQTLAAETGERIAALEAAPDEKTLVPETLVPETLVPETLVPETLVPETLVPETLVPETLVPETLVPETLVPETLVPKAPSETLSRPPVTTPPAPDLQAEQEFDK